MAITVLTESELRRSVDLDRAAVDIVAEGFRALARDQAVMPPVLSMAMDDRHGEVDVKTAYVRGLEMFAIKVSSGFFDNPKLGLPSLSGMMTLFSSETGRVQAVLLDNGYLTDLRTAAAGALAADLLAPQSVGTAGVIGTGLQARLQMRALHLVRPFRRLLVWGRHSANAEEYAENLRGELGTEIDVAASAEEVVRHSEVVVTTTPSQRPLIEAGWLHPGLHITAMGSDAEGKNELDPQVIARADRFVCDRRSQSAAIGELRAAIADGAVAEDFACDEVGAISAGMKPGRRADDEVTVCDLTGTGVQDTAIALYAYRRATEAGYGTSIDA